VDEGTRHDYRVLCVRSARALSNAWAAPYTISMRQTGRDMRGSPSEEIAAKLLPVGHAYLFHGQLPTGKDGQPTEHGPDAVFLADVAGACAEALLAADGEASRIHQVAKELPAGGDLEELHTKVDRHTVEGASSLRRVRKERQVGVTTACGGRAGDP